MKSLLTTIAAAGAVMAGIAGTTGASPDVTPVSAVASSPGSVSTTSPVTDQAPSIRKDQKGHKNISKEERLSEAKATAKRLFGDKAKAFYLPGDEYPTVDIPTVESDGPINPLLTASVLSGLRDPSVVAGAAESPSATTMAVWGDTNTHETTCSGHANYRLVQAGTGRNYCYTGYSGGSPLNGLDLYNIKGQCPGQFQGRFLWYTNYDADGPVYYWSYWRKNSDDPATWSKCWWNVNSQGVLVHSVQLETRYPTRY